MKYANVSVKFPRELDVEIERFLEQTGIYTNKSEFIKEACRTHLQRLQNDTAIAALRTEQLLAQAEQQPIGGNEIQDRLEQLSDDVDHEALMEAVDTAREETSEQVHDA